MSRDPFDAQAVSTPLPDGLVRLGPLEARVLGAVQPGRELTVARIAKLADCPQDVAPSVLRRLGKRMLIKPHASRPTGWLGTRHGELNGEHQP
jgi:hypothetical protein